MPRQRSTRETWRDRFRPIIGRVLAQFTPGTRLKTKRKALRAACEEIGARKRSYCYYVWLDEVRIQLGLRPPRFRTIRTRPSLPGQLPLFPDFPTHVPLSKKRRRA
jgi:hypothetical protein